MHGLDRHLQHKIKDLLNQLPAVLISGARPTGKRRSALSPPLSSLSGTITNKALETFSIGSWDYYYYRTRNGAEVDLILDGPFGTMPIEIKLGTSVNLRQLTSLRKYVKDHQLPYGLLINNADEVRYICEKVIQLPAKFL